MNLVIFDCDGVLVDSERLVDRIEAEYFSKLGLEITPDDVHMQFKGKTVEQVAAELEARTGRPLPASFAYEWASSVAWGFAQELRAVRGVERVIAAVQESGAKLCVASQSPLSRVRLSLHLTGLERHFGDNVFTASMVANPKPAPDLFLFAAQRMSVPADRTIVIEDSPSGVVAARAAGMRVYGYAADENAAALESAGATVFYSMDELRLDRGLIQDLV